MVEIRLDVGEMWWAEIFIRNGGWTLREGCCAETQKGRDTEDG